MTTIGEDTGTNVEAAIPNLVGVNMIPNEGVSGNLSSKYTIIFALGGPGSGKGTQCSKIATHFRFCHLSAGDLLDKGESGSDNGTMIKAFRMEGKLVPPEIVLKFLQQATEESEYKKFLIDDFPCNEENHIAAENSVGVQTYVF